MRHFVPLKSVPYLTGSIPLISTTYLIHHICPMWFFLFIPLTAISDSLDSMRRFAPLKSVPYFVVVSFHCFSVTFQFLRFTDISDSLDFMRRFAPLKSVPYFVVVSFHCFSVTFQFLRFTDISDSLDFMRRFAPLKSVPYLTGSISIIYITIKKVTSLRYGLLVLLNLLTRVKSEFESGGEHECPRHG